jgi:NAD(P)H-dependent FMN reductase
MTCFGQAYAKDLQFLVLSCSLSKNSHSALLAEQAVKDLKDQGQKVNFIDLRNYKLPIASGHEGESYDDPQVKEIHDLIGKADGIIIASPIYLNSVAAVTKNLVELTAHAHKEVLGGRVWQDKVVAFMGASGGKASTYAFFPLMNSLIIDSKIIVVPSFVMASSDDFNKQNQFNDVTKERINALTKDLVRITTALRK